MTNLYVFLFFIDCRRSHDCISECTLSWSSDLQTSIDLIIIQYILISLNRSLCDKTNRFRNKTSRKYVWQWSRSRPWNYSCRRWICSSWCRMTSAGNRRHSEWTYVEMSKIVMIQESAASSRILLPNRPDDVKRCYDLRHSLFTKWILSRHSFGENWHLKDTPILFQNLLQDAYACQKHPKDEKCTHKHTNV